MKKIIFLISLLFLVTSLQAKTQYVSKTVKAYSNPTDTKLSGKILTTTPLEVIKIEGDKALVKVIGWNQGKLKRIVYYSKGVRIIEAAFSKKANYERKVLLTDTSSKKPWYKVEITTWIENKNLVNELKPLFEQAKNLLATNCGLCHAAHPTHEFTANQWPALIKAMGPRTPMNKDQILLLTQYVQKHAKQ
jgi:trimethylamine-N-oxide reductase cytochrome c-type subunit TorC